METGNETVGQGGLSAADGGDDAGFRSALPAAEQGARKRSRSDSRRKQQRALATLGTMNDTDSTLLSYFDTAADGFCDRLRSVPDTCWENATPCTEWNVRQLANHMIQGSRIYTSLLRGGSSAEFMANLDHEALNGDLVTTYRGAVAECRAAFHAVGALDRIVDYPFGPVPGRQLLGLYVVDAVTHTWDLARAVRLDERLNAPTVHWILNNFQWIYHGVSESPITDSNRYYGSPTESPMSDTSEQDRLLHAMGRKL